MCESHINDIIRRNFNVKKVKSSHKKGLTEIISDEELNTEQLRSIIENTGYTVAEITAERYEKKGLFW